MKSYYVYMATNRSQTLYIGVTNDLERRMLEHGSANPGSFTGQYKISSLVYFEETSNIDDAIAREKQLKGWRRDKKTALIEQSNPDWIDLLNRPFDFAQGDKRNSGVIPNVVEGSVKTESDTKKLAEATL